MQSIVNSALYNNANTTCDQLETFAFANHHRCYIGNGFCTDILLSDQCQNLVCIGNEVFTDRDYYSKQAIDQVKESIINILIIICYVLYRLQGQLLHALPIFLHSFLMLLSAV